jgi:hypothetical protein
MGSEGLASGAAEAVSQRDAISANLLELDSSFGKRMLEGSTLAGRTKELWDPAAASLAGLWQTFTAYSAIVDRVAELAALRRPSPRETAELAELLTGPSVKLTQAPVPLARRDLADTGRRDLTLAAAVAAMRRAFGEITEVTAAAETVWTEVAGRLSAPGEGLAKTRQLLSGLDDDELASQVAAAQQTLENLRTAVNADPLTLWQGGRADTSAADRLEAQVTALAPRIAELDQVRQQARDRIAKLCADTEAARAERENVAAAWQRAAARVTAVPPLPPGIPEPPADSLTALAAAGQWSRLAAELSDCQARLDTAHSQTREAERFVASALGQRDELRGMLDAYKAKAARLGAAEDPALAELYARAYDMLWTAPCDLRAAADAVTGYQRAIRTMEGQRR